MKKLTVLLVLISAFFIGCGKSNTESKSVHSSENESTSHSTETKSSSHLESSTSKESEHSASSESTETATSSTGVAESDNSLAGYSDLQIEYARVWLATMGTTYKQWLDDETVGFELNVNVQPAGTPINPYAEDSAVFPVETTTLSGKYGYQSLVVYSSNHDGTINRYPVPSHFQGENTKEESQKILDSATIISIPTNNSEDVKQLIEHMTTEN